MVTNEGAHLILIRTIIMSIQKTKVEFILVFDISHPTFHHRDIISKDNNIEKQIDRNRWIFPTILQSIEPHLQIAVLQGYRFAVVTRLLLLLF